MELDGIASIGEIKEQLPHYRAALDAAVAAGDAPACRRFVDHGAGLGAIRWWPGMPGQAAGGS